MLYDPVYLVQAKARFAALAVHLHPQVFAPSLMRAAVRSASHVVELAYGVYQVGRSVVDCYLGICFCQAWRKSHRPCRHMLAVMLRSSCKPWDLVAGPAPEISTLKCRIRGKAGTWEIIEPHYIPGEWVCVSDHPWVWPAHVPTDHLYNITPVYAYLHQEEL
jgi:hypothetical protein